MEKLNNLKKELVLITGTKLINIDKFFKLYSSVGFTKKDKRYKYLENLKKLITDKSIDMIAKKETLLRLLRYSFVVNDPLTLYENLLVGNNNFFIGSLETDIIRVDNSLTNKPIIFLPIVLEGLSSFSDNAVRSIMHIFDVRNIIYKNDLKSAIYKKIHLSSLLQKQTEFEINLQRLLDSVFKNSLLINIHERFICNDKKDVYRCFSKRLKERASTNNFWRSLPQTMINQANISLPDATKLVSSEIKGVELYEAYQNINSYSFSNITKNFVGYILPEFIISTLTPYTDGTPLLYGRFRYRELQQSFLRFILIYYKRDLSSMNINLKKLTPICYPVRPEMDRAEERTLINTTFFNFYGDSSADLRIGDSDKKIKFNLEKLSKNDVRNLIKKIFIPYWVTRNELPVCIRAGSLVEIHEKFENIYKYDSIGNQEISQVFVESILYVNQKYSHILL